MDWKIGDNTLSPFSHQQRDPVPHYKEKIFPKVQDAFEKMSYGKYSIEIDTVPEVVRFLRNRNSMPGRLPFPALYNQAREALSHGKFADKYLFREYDLVFVLHPHVQPVGTKGVAWLGSRGAVCNGCETIDDNFKVMVMVHELGHNLGLNHASSVALEYGNPFDWMGNYPDVVGLHYGLGYKRELNWIIDDNIFTITDQNVDSMNDMVTIKPFDMAEPQAGDLVGVRIHLEKNNEDVYLSFRNTADPAFRGLYVTWQSKDSPNAK